MHAARTDKLLRVSQSSGSDGGQRSQYTMTDAEGHNKLARSAVIPFLTVVIFLSWQWNSYGGLEVM